MDALERIKKLSRKELIAEIRHLQDEQIEYEEKLGKQMQWMSVNDRLPDEGQKIDILKEAWGREIDHTFRDGEFIYGDAYVVVHEVTHWMPIPPNPKENNDE